MNPYFPNNVFQGIPFAIYPMYMPFPYYFPPPQPPMPISTPKEPRFVNINVIYSGFDLPKTAEGKPKFRMHNNHFFTQVIAVDIVNMTGNDLIRSLGGDGGSSLQEVFEHGGGDWTLGYKEIKYDSGSAKKHLLDYGWARGGNEDNRRSTIWVVFKRS